MSADSTPPAFVRAPTLGASLAVALAGSLGGLLWIPLRQMQDWGLSEAWASLGFFWAALPAVIPLALWRWRSISRNFLPLLVTGLATGGAFVCYALSLLLTDVVRALLLFYVTPLWGTLLAWMVMGTPLTRRRMLALALAVGGLLVIVAGAGGAGLAGLALDMNLGDGLGLLSGMLWAWGTLRIYRAPHGGGLDQGLAFFVGACLIALPALWILPPETVGPLPDLAIFAQSAPIAFGSAVLVYLPAVSVIFWAALHLDPGRVGLLLMSEAVVGLGSAALLTDEPFGLREATGAALILGASLADIVVLRRRSAQLG